MLEESRRESSVCVEEHGDRDGEQMEMDCEVERDGKGRRIRKIV